MPNENHIEIMRQRTNHIGESTRSNNGFAFAFIPHKSVQQMISTPWNVLQLSTLFSISTKLHCSLQKVITERTSSISSKFKLERRGRAQWQTSLHLTGFEDGMSKAARWSGRFSHWKRVKFPKLGQDFL